MKGFQNGIHFNNVDRSGQSFGLSSAIECENDGLFVTTEAWKLSDRDLFLCFLRSLCCLSIPSQVPPVSSGLDVKIPRI